MYRAYKKVKRNFIPEKSVKTLGSQSLLQNKLDAMEEIRNDLGTDGIEVPGVVVAGSQSSGKSSVLESLSGIRLPSGNTITTRVPLILRLEKRSVEKPFAIIHDTSDLTQGEHVNELSLIPKKIEEYTKRITGDTGSVVDSPIHLKVIQQDGPTVTLIDLPGITHMSVDNVQEDIHTETVNLVKKYIKNEHMIILCVVPAMDDFANSEAIKMSKEIDPDGERTIGVITKIDICQDDITDKIKGSGRNVSLKLGFVAVKNRGPKENDFTTKELRKSENSFFEHSAFYNSLEHNYWGMGHLIDKIVQLQSQTIDAYLPKIVDTLNKNAQNIREELSSDQYNFETSQDKYRFLTKSIFQIKTNANLDKQLYTYFSEYGSALKNNVPDFFGESFHDTLKENVKKHHGNALPNFISQPLFESVLSDTQKQIHEHTNDLINKTYIHVKSVMKEEMRIFNPDVSAFIYANIVSLLDETKAKILENTGVILDSEKTVYTQNEYYMNEIKDIRAMAVNEETDDKIPNEYLKKFASSSIGNDTHMVCELQASLFAYSNVYINRIIDVVPMIISRIIKTFYENLSHRLMENITMDTIEKYMMDDETLILEKHEMENKLRRFENALSLLYSL
jgi:interferon-induced GTP-binding protein Mx1